MKRPPVFPIEKILAIHPDVSTRYLKDHGWRLDRIKRDGQVASWQAPGGRWCHQPLQADASDDFAWSTELMILDIATAQRCAQVDVYLELTK